MPINRDTVEEFWSGPILEKFIRQGIPDYISPLPIFQKFLNISHNRIYDFASGRASLEWLLCNLITNKKQVLHLHLLVQLLKTPSQILIYL